MVNHFPPPCYSSCQPLAACYYLYSGSQGRSRTFQFNLFGFMTAIFIYFEDHSDPVLMLTFFRFHYNISEEIKALVKVSFCFLQI